MVLLSRCFWWVTATEQLENKMHLSILSGVFVRRYKYIKGWTNATHIFWCASDVGLRGSPVMFSDHLMTRRHHLIPALQHPERAAASHMSKLTRERRRDKTCEEARVKKEKTLHGADTRQKHLTLGLLSVFSVLVNISSTVCVHVEASQWKASFECS